MPDLEVPELTPREATDEKLASHLYLHFWTTMLYRPYCRTLLLNTRKYSEIFQDSRDVGGN